MATHPAATAMAPAPGPRQTAGAAIDERTQSSTPSPEADPGARCADCGRDRGVHTWKCPAVLGPHGGPGGIIRAWELAHEPPQAAEPEAGL